MILVQIVAMIVAENAKNVNEKNSFIPQNNVKAIGNKKSDPHINNVATASNFDPSEHYKAKDIEAQKRNSKIDEYDKELWESKDGINYSNNKDSLINCQSTACNGGEYPGWYGCISTSIAAMFRINDGAVGPASSLVKSDDDGTDPDGGLNGYSYENYNKSTVTNGGGCSQSNALDAIKNELASGKVCAVKIANGGQWGHTVVCSGVKSGISLKDATWNDLLFNDVGRGSTDNRKAKPISELDYTGTDYNIPEDGDCCVIIDTTK